MNELDVNVDMNMRDTQHPLNALNVEKHSMNQNNEPRYTVV